MSLPTERIENGDAGAGGVDPSLLVGIIKGAEGEGSVQILNPQRLLRDFGQLGVARFAICGGHFGCSRDVGAVGGPRQRKKFP